MYTKFDITVQSIINVEYLSLLATQLLDAGNPATHNPAEIMKAVRSRLLQQRKTLSYKFNDVELIPAKQSRDGSENTLPGTVDAKNGPLPQSCIINTLTNTTFLITYHIIAHYWENLNINFDRMPLSINDRGHNVISNRWTESVEIDECLYTTRIREGVYFIRSDNREALIADQLRTDMAVLSVPTGFVRDSATYTVSKDGLSLTYKIVDKEVYRMPPIPAFKADGEYVESAVLYGNVRLGKVRVKLRGTKVGKQVDLLRIAMAICVKIARDRSAILTGNKLGVILKEAHMHQWLYDSIVEFSLNVQYQQGHKRTQRLAGFTRLSDVVPFSDRDGPQPEYLDRGTASLIIAAASYYDPSILENTLGKGILTLPNAVTQPGNSRIQMKKGQEVGTAGLIQEP